MKVISQPAEGLYLIESTKKNDTRGLFQRLFCEEELHESWGSRKIIQVNRSITEKKGAFRGFHMQKPPFCEMKFIQCLHGSVYDIAIDLRANSKTFLNYFHFELTSTNNLCVIIPEGFAHGFQTLAENSELIYFHSAPFKHDYELGIHYQDPHLKINLPLPISDISMKDTNIPYLPKNYKGIQL